MITTTFARSLRIVLSSAIALGVTSLAFADSKWPSAVKEVTSTPNGTVETSGNLSSGAKLDLAWAANSSVACFPATNFDSYRGNHVLYATSIPKDSIMTITAVPADGQTDVSLYAYTMGTTDFTHVPPNVPSATACEASFGKSGKNPGVSEKITLNATTHPYNVVIGVAGPKDVTSGAYTLKIELKSKTTTTSATLVPIALSTSSGSATANGKLEDGGKIDLAWASNSSVACFPATKNVDFTGNHVIYRAALPSQSTMTVTATPKSSSLDLSVYAYMVADGDTTTVPPNVPSAVSCEAGYDQKNDHNPGTAETAKLNSTTHAYTVYIGVAGAAGTTSGAYDLKVDVKKK